MAAKRKAISRASSSRIKTSGRKLPQSKLPKAKARPEPATAKSSCPIVGIGGSAGGFEAALFDLVPVAVYTCDANGIIQQYNRRAVELWGQEPSRNGASARFCGSFKIFHLDGQPMPHEKCPLARALRGEKLEPKDLEIVVERPCGERRHVIPAPQILKDSRGKIIGAINSLFDITEQKRAEADAMRLAALVR